MRFNVFIISIMLAFFTFAATWNLVKTKFPILIYSPTIEHGGTNIADYDSAAIKLDSEKTRLTFFTSIGDSAKIDYISDTNDTVNFKGADSYYFDNFFYLGGGAGLKVTGAYSSLDFTDTADNVSSEIRHVSYGTCTYLQTTYNTMFTFPANTQIWSIRIEVLTGFNDTGLWRRMWVYNTNTTTTYYSSNDVGSPGWLAEVNCKERMAGIGNIQSKFQGQNGDASQGLCRIWVIWSQY